MREPPNYTEQARRHLPSEKEQPAMQTWDAIRARRNVRAYTRDPVSDEDLNRILEAGWRSPSAFHWASSPATTAGRSTPC